MKRTMTFLLFALALLAGSVAHAADWDFDRPHTQIKFKVKHLAVAYVWGQFHQYEGKISYDPSKPMDTSVSVSIDVNSIDTGNETRDNHLRSEDFFYVEKYPKMTFVSKKVTVNGGKMKIIGDLTIRGIAKEVTLDVDGPRGPVNMMGTSKIAATATTSINRTDYGLLWNRAIETGGVVVGDMVDIIIDAELNKL